MLSCVGSMREFRVNVLPRRNMQRLITRVIQVLLFRVSCDGVPSDFGKKGILIDRVGVQVHLDRSWSLSFEQGEIPRRTLAVLFRVRVSFRGYLHMGKWPRKCRSLCALIPCGACHAVLVCRSSCDTWQRAEFFHYSISLWLCTLGRFPRIRSTHNYLLRSTMQCAIPHHSSQFGSLYLPR